VIRKDPRKRVNPGSAQGPFEQAIGGTTVVVEYEADPDLRDSEQVHCLVRAASTYLEREVLLYALDAAWYDPANPRSATRSASA